MANALTIEEEMQRVEKASLELILKVLRTDNVPDEMLERTRIGQAAFSAIQRRRQSDSAREATNFQMARALSENRDELAAYIRITSPDIAIVKALPAPKDDN